MRYPRYGLILCLIVLTSCGSPTPPAGPAVQPPAPTMEQPSGSPAAQPSPSAAPTPTLVAVQPTATEQPAPTSAPAAEPTTAAPAQRTITITEPKPGASVSNSITIKGQTNYWPFEANLTAQLKDASGNVLATIPVTVHAPDIGQGGPFEEQMTFRLPAQAQTATLEIFEASAKDGSMLASQSVQVQLQAGETRGGLQLDAPVEGQAVTLPMHVAFRGVQPNQSILGRLRFGNGETLEQTIPVVVGTDNVGYGVANIDWNTESMPPAVPPGATTFEIVGGDGAVLQSVGVRLLAEAETQRVDVVWTTPEADDFIVFKHDVPRTPQIASAALNELLKGPPDGNAAGAVTALPTVQEIVTFPGRQPDWGYEVRLIKLTITNGVATANFSKELRAYGGGAARVQAIRQQIERTLRQFKSVQSVVIQIEGQSEGVLEP
ncbi:MAG TPA: Gmad2 immunoglobulin-like domain-containing protein [Herpetosiphonaceae bacterium]